MFTFMPCTSDHLSFFFSHRVFSPGTTCLLRACRKKKKKKCKINRRSSHVGASSAVNARNLFSFSFFFFFFFFFFFLFFLLFI